MEFNINRVRQIAEIMAKEVCEKISSGTEIEQIELTLRELAKAAAGAGLQKVIEAQEGPYPAEVTCACGQTAQADGKRKAVVWSVFGKVAYRRRYYGCAHCHRGQSPLDKRLGLKPGESTPGLASLLGILGVETSFAEASQLAERFLLFRVSDNTVRKQTEGYGKAQAQAEMEWKQFADDIKSLEVRERSMEKRAGRIYGSLDGAHVPLHGEWRELKTLCWYEVQAMHPSHPKNHHGQGVGEQNHLQARNMKYYCDIQEAEQLGRLLWASAIQQQVDAYEEIVFVSDGAVWIWNLVQKYFPNAVQIVDWYHASQYLSPIAEAAFGAHTPQAHEWLTQARSELWEGQIQDVIHSCHSLWSYSPARPFIEKAMGYYNHNEKRMDYARFRQQGYLIGSGTIESACKQIAAARLKRAGARWTLSGVIATAKARAAWLSKAWDSLKPIYSLVSYNL